MWRFHYIFLPAHFLLVHGTESTGNRPQIVHHHGAGLAPYIQHDSIAVYAIIHLLPGFQGHGLIGPVVLFSQAAGNFLVTHALLQPARNFIFSLFIQ